MRSHWLEMEFEYGPAYYGEIGEMRVHCMVSSVDVYNQLQAHDGLLGEPFPGIHAERRAVHAHCARLVGVGVNSGGVFKLPIILTMPPPEMLVGGLFQQLRMGHTTLAVKGDYSTPASCCENCAADCCNICKKY